MNRNEKHAYLLLERMFIDWVWKCINVKENMENYCIYVVQGTVRILTDRGETNVLNGKFIILPIAKMEEREEARWIVGTMVRVLRAYAGTHGGKDEHPFVRGIFGNLYRIFVPSLFDGKMEECGIKDSAITELTNRIDETPKLQHVHYQTFSWIDSVTRID